MLATLAADHQWDREALLQEVEKLALLRNKEYESIRVVNRYGQSWSSYDKPFSIVDREYYVRLCESDASYVVSNRIQSHANQADIVVILYRIKPQVYDEAAYISAAVSIEAMQEIAKDINVYDGKGELLFDHEFYAPQTGQPGRDDETARNADKMATFIAPIEQVPHWELKFQVPHSQLLQGVDKTQRSALLVGGVTGFVFFLLLILLGNSIVKPIRSLQKIMGKVEAGDRNIRATENHQDEIGDLGRSFNQMLAKLYHYEQEKKEMELRLIQEQIKPHFLYNTLDTIQWKAGAYGADDVVELVESLSTYFRLGLGGCNQFITLEQEFHHVESYLQIQCVRYEEILEYELMYDEHLGSKRIIRFLLQPLVENAIYHGIKPLIDQKSKISIRTYEKDRDMHIVVENNGLPISEDRMKVIQQALSSSRWKDGTIGFGLYSVNHRLKLTYGEPYGLKVDSRHGVTTMTLILPLEEIE
ncbi:sensor histidine kinase [Paenibacillus motobuensis]|uniref:HAMP domain-containing protein n=1 Tax=Paenibacillus motobuensis TaxID=295324 RepID=A0ABN0Y6S5_9BACL